MKRIACALLALCLFPAFSLCESVDISALSFDDLKTLQTRIAAEMVNRQEWKETAVPKGQYEVGKDIPEGEYRMTIPEGKAAHVVITDPAELITRQKILDWYAFNDTDVFEKIILREGYIFMIDVGTVVLSPVIPLEF